MAYSYKIICKKFGELTRRRSASGLCCTKVIAGVPLCCSTLVDGTCKLEFTKLELDLVCGADWAQRFEENGLRLVPMGSDWPEVYYGEVCDRQLMTDSLRDGLLSTVLENVSHPTRPILSSDGRSVVGVASVYDCIAEYAATELRGNYEQFRDLWSAAVELTGLKPGFSVSGKLPPHVWCL